MAALSVTEGKRLGISVVYFLSDWYICPRKHTLFLYCGFPSLHIDLKKKKLESTDKYVKL